MTDIDVVTWGDGDGSRAVLVHGSLATGPLEWEQQRPLTTEGYQLVVPTRRAYSTTGIGEDFLVDGQDVAELLGDGAHLVGHSYGAVVALVAARARPGAVRSLVLAEPPLFGTAGHPAATRLEDQLARLLNGPEDDREFLARFLELVGTSVEDLPPDLVDELVRMAPSLRQGRMPWHTEVPVAFLSSAPFPTVAVSGDHHPGFTAVCEALAREVGATHQVVPGAGHEMQLVAEEFNALLLRLWRETDRPPASPA